VDNDRHARWAVDAGARSIEHVPPDLSDETIRAMVSTGTTLTPTLAASDAMVKILSGAAIKDTRVERWVEPAVLASLDSPNSWIANLRRSPKAIAYYTRRYEQQRAALRRAISAGVVILAGTDAGNAGVFHGLSLIHELELLVEEGGMAPESAIAAATSEPAKRLGREDIGHIKPGGFADLVVLSADPTKDIRALRNVYEVYLGGVPIQPETALATRPGNWHPLFSFPARPE
jgi:imidazolonepropionase-like amidohydrolase